MSLPEYVTINGTSYASAKLSEGAVIQVANVQAADQEIARLQQQLAFVQTARNAYVNALIGEVKAKVADKTATVATSMVAASKEGEPEATAKPRAPRKAAAKADAKPPKAAKAAKAA